LRPEVRSRYLPSRFSSALIAAASVRSSPPGATRRYRFSRGLVEMTPRSSARAAQAGIVIGSSTRKVVRPGAESTSMRPLCLRTTMLWLMLRPSPVPCPGGLVVKNGSNTFAATSGGIPGPSSSISATT